MNTHVNFETAKLLKEKGFEGIISPLWYYKDGTLHETPTEGYKGLKCWNIWESTQGVRWDAPTIAEVVMWLYEKHGIWIMVKREDYKTLVRWVFYVNNNYPPQHLMGHDLLTKAYEAAILYTLNNLI